MTASARSRLVCCTNSRGPFSHAARAGAGLERCRWKWQGTRKTIQLAQRSSAGQVPRGVLHVGDRRLLLASLCSPRKGSVQEKEGKDRFSPSSPGVSFAWSVSGSGCEEENLWKNCGAATRRAAKHERGGVGDIFTRARDLIRRRDVWGMVCWLGNTLLVCSHACMLPVGPAKGQMLRSSFQ